MVSDDRGDIEASATDPTGLFSFDTRHLSRWILTLDDQRLTALSTDDLQYFESRFFLVPGTGTVYIDAKQTVIRRRRVADGFHEELTVLNHSDEPIDVKVGIEAASDFADLFEVKDALAKKGSYSTEIDDGSLRLTYRRDTFFRATVISASEPCEMDDDGLRFQIHVEPHDAWKTDIKVSMTVLGVGEEGSGRRWPFAGLAGARSQDRSGGRSSELDGRVTKAGVRVGASAAELPAQPRRSRRAPVFPDFRRRQQPAGGGPALVHDHVRSRQHLHQPAGSAVQLGASSDHAPRTGPASGHPIRRLPR